MSEAPVLSRRSPATWQIADEDPVWGGDEERVKAGLEFAHRTLRSLLVR